MSINCHHTFIIILTNRDVNGQQVFHVRENSHSTQSSVNTPSDYEPPDLSTNESLFHEFLLANAE